MSGDGDRVDEEILGEILQLSAAGGSGGQPSLFDRFVTETLQRIERLGESVNAGDLDQAARAAHSVKGSAGAFGARRLSSLGAEAEEAAIHGDARRVSNLIPRLEEELAAFSAIVSSRRDA